MKDFLLGCNFWDSKSGTDMWINFDEESLKADLDALQASGVGAIRCFPIWRDFQPVIALRSWRGIFKEYRLAGDRFPENEYYIDMTMIERFRIFARIAEEHGIKLVVSILTGWMSGRLFYPPALDSKNLVTDPEALMFEEKFVRGFVEYTKDIKNIVMWDLGNECNCLGMTSSRAESYLWTVTVRNAILASDRSRPISSGMHGLDFNPNGKWPIADQGALCDLLSNHPYPSPTIGGDMDAANKMKTTMLPTAQCEYYSGLSGKPTMLQEQGTFCDLLINREGAADFMRVNICSAIANNIKGYFWWCSHEHLHLKQPPYTWSMNERELGLLDENREQKPVGREMKRMAKIISALPDIPEKQNDALIVLTNEQDTWKVGSTSYILAKRAGLTPAFVSCNERDIPYAPIYFLPSVCGWAPMSVEPYNAIIEHVEKDGATLFVSVSNGSLCEFERISGLTSLGMFKAGNESMELDGETYKIQYNKKFELRSIGAEVLATDSQGTPVFTCHKLGRGKVYILGFPLEAMLADTPSAYERGKTEYSRLYAKAAGEILSSKLALSEEPDTSLTLHPVKGGAYAIAVNYTNAIRDARIKLAQNTLLTPIYGDLTAIAPCDMAVAFIEKI